MILLPGNKFKEEGRAMYISSPRLLYVTGEPVKLISRTYPLSWHESTVNGFYGTPEEDRWSYLAEYDEKKINGDYTVLFRFIVTVLGNCHQLGDNHVTSPPMMPCFQMDIATDFNHWWYVKSQYGNDLVMVVSSLAITKSSLCDESLSLYYHDKNIMLDMVSTMVA